MDREELQSVKMQITKTAELLYQNRAEGISEAAALLPVIQQIGNTYTVNDAEKELRVLKIMRSLIEGYKALDVLRMADVLCYETVGFIDFCLTEGE